MRRPGGDRPVVEVERGFVFAAVGNQRRQIADLIDDLDDAQLATMSLCAGWDVKTVAAHLVSVFADSFLGFHGTGDALQKYGSRD